MPTIIWQFDLDDGPHTVSLEHAWMSGKRIIQVDGQLIHISFQLLDKGSEHAFQIGYHWCIISIVVPVYTISQIDHALYIDGRRVSPMSSRYLVLDALPVWAWCFILACAEIHLIGWAGWLSLLPALTGVVACATIADIPTLSTFIQIVMCTAVTILAWLFFLAIHPL